MAVDAESRTMKDRYDWMITLKIFQQTQQSLGPLQIRCSARVSPNKTTSHCYSWRPDPEAEATDAELGLCKGICKYQVVAYFKVSKPNTVKQQHA